jgi:beta-xylosidase
MNNEKAAMGRICYLEPVKWGEDDWPVFGNAGKPVGSSTKPGVGKTYPIVRPTTSDEFNAKTLGWQWQWNHNPLNDRWSLTEKPGALRLKASPAENLAVARNTLTQKLWDEAGVVDVKLDLSGMSDGQRAGLAFMTGNRFGWVGVVRNQGELRIDWQDGQGPSLSGATVWLRGTYQDLNCHFAYSLDGRNFVETPSTFKMGFQSWKGGRPAIYSYGAGSGFVDVDYFHYRYGSTLDAVLAADADH